MADFLCISTKKVRGRSRRRTARPSGAPKCAFCQKRLPLDEERYIGYYAPDPVRNPDVFYWYQTHIACMLRELADPKKPNMLRVESVAKEGLDDFLRSVPTKGNA